MMTPSWPAILLGLAPPLALALWGLAVGGKDFARRHALLLLWAAGALLLCRLPVWFQRKMLFGVQILKDAAADKPTYVSLLGLTQAQELAQQLHAESLAALNASGLSTTATAALRALASQVVERKN